MAFEEELGFTEDEIKQEKKRVGHISQIMMVFGFFKSRIGVYLALILMLVIYGIIQGSIVTFMVGEDVVTLSALLAADPLSFIFNVYELGQAGTDVSTMTIPIALAAVLMLGGFIVSVLVIGAIMRFTLERYEGGDMTIGHSIAAAMSRLVTLFIVQLVVSTVTSFLLRPLAPLSALMNSTTDLDVLAELSTVTLLLLLPILLSYTLLLVSMVVVMDTNAGPFRSLWQSITYTSRNLVYSIMAVLVFLIVIFVIQVVIEVAFLLLLGEYGYLISAFIYQVIALPLIYIFQTTLYKQLAAAPERSTAQELW